MDDDWSTSLVKGYLETEERKNSSGLRAGRPVLVLNGPACFIAGTLASTGEPRVSERSEGQEQSRALAIQEVSHPLLAAVLFVREAPPPVQTRLWRKEH